MRRLILALLAVVSLGTGLPAHAQTAQTPQPAATAAAVQAQPDARRARANARVFDRVWSMTRRIYYDPDFHGVDWEAARTTYRPRALAAADEQALYSVLSEMMDRLDDAHAGVQSPTLSHYDRRRDQPRPLLGLLLLREKGGRYLVEDVREGSPAESSEIEFGWELKTVNGQPFHPGRLFHAGVPVTAEFVDAAGAPRTLSLTPQLMPAPLRRNARFAAPDVLVISFDQFERGIGRWVDRQLRAAPAGTRVVLDLRNNRGGLVNEANNVLSCFLPPGQEWLRHRMRGRDEHAMRLRRGCRAYPGALAVLVNGGSRSAAELVPAVLQESGRAVIVGRRSAGDVLISMDYRLPDGGEISLSVADLKTGKGTRLEHVGVTPDVEAHTTLADRRAGRDPALDAAVAAVRARP